MNQRQGKGAESKHQSKENVVEPEGAVTRSCAQCAGNKEMVEYVWSKQLCQAGDLCM